MPKIPEYRRQNVSVSVDQWSALVSIAGELTAESGERVPFYKALQHILQIGLEEYNSERRTHTAKLG